MDPWSPTPEQAHQAKVILSGMFGGLLRAFHVYPGSWWRVALLMIAGGVMATLFADIAAEWMGIGEVPAGLIVGIVGWGVAGALMRASDKLEIPTKEKE